MQNLVKIILGVITVIFIFSCKKNKCLNNINGRFKAKGIIINNSYSLGDFFGSVEIKNNKFYQYIDIDTANCDLCITEDYFKFSNWTKTSTGQSRPNSQVKYIYYQDSIDLYNSSGETIFRYIKD